MNITYLNKVKSLGKFKFGAIFCKLSCNPIFGAEVLIDTDEIGLYLYLFRFGLELEIDKDK